MDLAGASLLEAVDAASTNPMRLLASRERAPIRRGGYADFVLLTSEFNVAATIVKGRLAHRA